MIYLDNAATSHPKPTECFQQGLRTYLRMGASPGRGGYDMAVEAEELVEDVRQKVRRFFGGGENHHVCFTQNATDSLNILLQGLSEPGSHVVSSRLEHNSVLRPLHHLNKKGVLDFDLAPFNNEGIVEPDALARLVRPNTKFAIITHASNVLGTIQPVKALADVCREKGVPLLLDVSQSAGVEPVRMNDWGVAGVAFTGHKSLLGPTGIGGLVVSPEINPQPSRFGGTGMDSHSLIHSPEYPHRLEAGTLNLLGILILGQCLDYLESSEHKIAVKNEKYLLKELMDGLDHVDRIQILGPVDVDRRLPVIACNFSHMAPKDAADILDGDFGIAVRSGLHCAPLAHQDLGSGKNGALRFSLGPFNTKEHIDAALAAVSRIAQA